MLADSASPHGLSVPILGGYIVPRASHRAVANSACLGRERLMEQPVSSGHYSCKTETQATYRSHKNILCQIEPNLRNVHRGRSCWFKWSLDTSTLAHLMPRQAGASMPLLIPVSEKPAPPLWSVRRENV